jgi:hypothetical protein
LPHTTVTALDLRKTNASASEIDPPRKVLPACRIDWDGAAEPAKK